MEEIRILLVGKTGSGKSSVGNTILGKDVFKVDHTSRSCTQKCQREEVVRGNTRYVVVDTPGIYDTNLPTARQLKELIRAIIDTQPGFHIIAFVMKRGDKYTEELQETQKRFYEWFGNDVDQFSCLILTNTKDQSEKETYLADPHQYLEVLLERTSNRLAIFENNGPRSEKEKQVNELMAIVDNIITQNNDNCFTNLMYQLYKMFNENIDIDEIGTDTIRLLNHIKQTDGFQWAMGEYERAESTPGGASVGRLHIVDEASGNYEDEAEYINTGQHVDETVGGNKSESPGTLHIFNEDGSRYQFTNSNLVNAQIGKTQRTQLVETTSAAPTRTKRSGRKFPSADSHESDKQLSLVNAQTGTQLVETTSAAPTRTERSGRMFPPTYSNESDNQLSLVNVQTGEIPRAQFVETTSAAPTRTKRSGSRSPPTYSNESDNQLSLVNVQTGEIPRAQFVETTSAAPTRTKRSGSRSPPTYSDESDNQLSLVNVQTGEKPRAQFVETTSAAPTRTKRSGSRSPPTYSDESDNQLSLVNVQTGEKPRVQFVETTSAAPTRTKRSGRKFPSVDRNESILKLSSDETTHNASRLERFIAFLKRVFRSFRQIFRKLSQTLSCTDNQSHHEMEAVV